MKNARSTALIFRRRGVRSLVLILVPAIGALIALAGGQGDPARDAQQAAQGGYSIFNETMVDMAWPAVTVNVSPVVVSSIAPTSTACPP